MGSLVYFGLSVSSLFVSIIFQKLKASWVLGIMMIGNALACFIFSVSSNILLLYFMRFMLGFTQAFCVIYGPVWVNEFSPRENNTKWMAILHSFVVIGVMAGYIIGAITITLFEGLLSWRYAFMLQGWFMILIGIGFILTENKQLDIFALFKESGATGSAGGASKPKNFSDAVAGDGLASAPSLVAVGWSGIVPPTAPNNNNNMDVQSQGNAEIMSNPGGR